MKQLFSSTTGLAWGVIDTPLAASILADPEARRFLMPFVGQALTAGQAAGRIGARIDTMLYRIERLQDAGLLARVEAPGRKRYRATADRFVVPFDATHHDSLVELVIANDAHWNRQFAQGLVGSMAGDGGGWMLRVHRDGETDSSRYTVDAAPSGQIDWQMTEMLRPSAPATWYTAQKLRLEQTHAKALQHDLAELWQRYEALTLPAETATPFTEHVLQLHLAPVERHRP